VFHVKRIEALTPLDADVVTARALAPLPALLGHAARHLAPGGVAILPKGKEVERELTAARKAWKMTVESLPSRSDPAGTLLRIGDLTA
jgi:16S rRNA (guanine527-N7)-methyltransferase